MLMLIQTLALLLTLVVNPPDMKVTEAVDHKTPTTLAVSRSKSIDILSPTMNLLTYSGLTEKQLKTALKDTALESLAPAYLEAEETTHVNALFLVSLSAHESGWGKSLLARERNNLFGFKAYDHDVSQAVSFESQEACIMYVAKYLKDHYLLETGKYYRGTTLASINVRYASDKEWAVKIFNTMKSIQEKAR